MRATCAYGTAKGIRLEPGQADIAQKPDFPLAFTLYAVQPHT